MKNSRIYSLLMVILLFSSCKESSSNHEQGVENDTFFCEYSKVASLATYDTYIPPQINRNLSFMPISIFNDFDYANNGGLVRVEFILSSGFRMQEVRDTVFTRANNCLQCNDDYLQLDFGYTEDSLVQSDSMIVVSRAISQEDFEQLEFIVVCLNGERKKVVTANSNVAPIIGKSDCTCGD